MPEQTNPFRRFNLRRQSADHPMAMFAVVVLATLALMALMPPPGLALPSIVPAAAASAAQAPDPAGEEHALVVQPSETACSGQIWSAESAACLLAIARESGRDDRLAVRRIAFGRS